MLFDWMVLTTITDLPEQGVPLEAVQRLAVNGDPSTTRLYDLSDRNSTRNLVERIPVKHEPRTATSLLAGNTSP